MEEDEDEEEERALSMICRKSSSSRTAAPFFSKPSVHLGARANTQLRRRRLSLR